MTLCRRLSPFAAFLAIAILPWSAHAITAKRPVFSVNSYGAKPDGITIDTQAIQAALDVAGKARHAMVTFAPGTYLTGAIFVKSGTELHIPKGVTLRAVHGLKNYPLEETRIAGIDMRWPAAVINVYEQDNVSITGHGTVDGRGKYWWNGYWEIRRKYDKIGLRWAADYDDRRPRLIEFYRSNHIQLASLRLIRSPFWTVHICYSSHVLVDGITIRNNIGGRGPSTDGVDIDSSDHVLVENADISDNDDALCLKSGRDSDGLSVNRPTEDVVIRNSIVREGAAAVTFGSETSGGFRNIDIYNIRAVSPVPSGILFKSAHTRGGWADNVNIHDIHLTGVSIPVHITMNWNPSYSYAHIPSGLKNVPRYYHILATPVPPSLGLPHFRNVHIWNVTATGAQRAFDVSAMPSAPLVNFTLNKIHISAQTAGTISNARGWAISHVTVKTADGSEVRFKSTTNLTLTKDTGIEGTNPR
jgi:polygalacturonase